MAIRVIVSMTAAPGKSNELAAAFAALCPLVQQEPGCEQYEMFQSREDPHRFVLIEKWDNEDNLRLHSDAMKARNLNLGDLRSSVALERFQL